MNNSISFTKLGTLSPLIKDYLTQNTNLSSFYNLFPSKENILKQAKEKSNFKYRELLVKELSEQNTQLKLTLKQKHHINQLKAKNCFTITTGHQLNLFSGPLFSIIKILQTIKLCDELNESQKELHFVPIFWMATEDHDFEEINHFWFNERKVVWHTKQTGAVGRFSTESLEELADCFFSQISNNQHKTELQELFSTSYLRSNSLSSAHRSLINELFKNLGLLILDADCKSLKELMIPAFKHELLNQTSFETVAGTNQKFEKFGYKVQVNPREINLFYLKEGLRERIVFENNQYNVLNTELSFTKNEILQELEDYPDRFSPNVILRPLYQETILPNVAYIGGNGEISYWLQLKSYFDTLNVKFPILIPRNSFLLKSEKSRTKQEKLNISDMDLFLPLQRLIQQKVSEKSTLSIDFHRYEHSLKSMFSELKSKSVATDITFANMVEAQQKKQLKGIQKMKQRMQKAEVKVHQNLAERIQSLHQEFFPNSSLQERNQNFSIFYLAYGMDFVNSIYKNISPLEPHFNFITLAEK